MKSHIIRKSKFSHVIVSDIQKSSLVPITSPGYYGIISQKSAFIYMEHILALTRVLKFHYKRGKKHGGRFSINLHLNKELTKKAIGVRMGKGKGPVDRKVFFMRPGFFIFSFQDANLIRGRYVLSKCLKRLPVCCKVVRFDRW